MAAPARALRRVPRRHHARRPRRNLGDASRGRFARAPPDPRRLHARARDRRADGARGAPPAAVLGFAAAASAERGCWSACAAAGPLRRAASVAHAVGARPSGRARAGTHTHSGVGAGVLRQLALATAAPRPPEGARARDPCRNGALAGYARRARARRRARREGRARGVAAACARRGGALSDTAADAAGRRRGAEGARARLPRRRFRSLAASHWRPTRGGGD